MTRASYSDVIKFIDLLFAYGGVQVIFREFLDQTLVTAV